MGRRILVVVVGGGVLFPDNMISVHTIFSIRIGLSN